MPDKNPDAGPHDPAPHELQQHTTPPSLKQWGKIAFVIALVIAVAGISWRIWKSHTTAQWTEDQAVPTVAILKLSMPKTGGMLNLPGDVEPYTNAPIFAQVNGYLQKWYFDIGAKVRKNDLLAQIDPRPYQAALDQANGTLARDSATLANAKLDLARYQALWSQNAISQQQLATQQATVISDAGIVAADRAAVAQAKINLGYTRVIAPFDGIVTTRSVDVGNLVTVGTPTSTALFTVSDQSRMRIYVRLPQNYASYVRPNMTVTFTVPQYPNRIFRAQIVANAGAVASATGTELIQFGTDNSDHALQPGSYANVRFPLPAGANGIRLPATALMFRDSGMQVATVDATNHVHLKTVTILRDLGASLDIGGGVSPRDRIIDNPADALQEGDEVRIANR